MTMLSTAGSILLSMSLSCSRCLYLALDVLAPALVECRPFLLQSGVKVGRHTLRQIVAALEREMVQELIHHRAECGIEVVDSFSHGEPVRKLRDQRPDARYAVPSAADRPRPH